MDSIDYEPKMLMPLDIKHPLIDETKRFVKRIQDLVKREGIPLTEIDNKIINNELDILKKENCMLEKERYRSISNKRVNKTRKRAK